MAIKTIFVANLAEIARPLAQFMRAPRRKYEIDEDHRLCDRFVFSGSDDRVLITPFPLDPQFLNDSLKIMKYKNVANLAPKRVGESICESTLADHDLLDRIIRIIQENPGINIISYAGTPEFLELLKVLRKRGLEFSAPEVPMENLWTTAFFDSKSGFRQTVDKLGSSFPAMPCGAICFNSLEIEGFAAYLSGCGKDFLLKSNRGLAGAGLKIVKKSDIKNGNVAEHVATLVKKESYFRKDAVVVEEFIEPDMSVCGGAPNVELQLTDDGVEVLYVCGMRVTPQGVFKGVELGSGAVPAKLETLMIRSSKVFGNYLRRYGYRGFFELDFVFGKDGKPYPIEANLRRTGGTHVFELSKRVLGRDFVKNYYVVGSNMTDTKKFKGKSYSLVKEKVSKFLFPMGGKKEGVFLTIPGLLDRGNLGYVVVGRSHARVYQIEKEFLYLL